MTQGQRVEYWTLVGRLACCVAGALFGWVSMVLPFGVALVERLRGHEAAPTVRLVGYPEPPWDELDPGIVAVVAALWAAGLETTDSGDGSKHGVMEGALPIPHVAIRSSRHRVVDDLRCAERVLFELGYELGPDGWTVEGTCSLVLGPFEPEFIVMVYGPAEVLHG